MTSRRRKRRRVHHVHNRQSTEPEIPRPQKRSFRQTFIEKIPPHILSDLAKDFRMNWCISSPFQKLLQSVVRAPSDYFVMLERVLKRTRKTRWSSWMTPWSNPGRSSGVCNVELNLRNLLEETIRDEGIDISVRVGQAADLPYARVVSLLIQKFRFLSLPHSDHWQQAPDEKILREEEQKVLLSHRPWESFTQVSMFQGRLSIPMEVYVMILSYLERDYSLLASVGLVSEEFFVGFLLSWNKIRVSPGTLQKISLLTFRSVSKIEVVSPFDLTVGKKSLGRKDWDYFWTAIQPHRIRILDFSDMGAVPRGFTEFLASFELLEESNRPVFGGCYSLSLPLVEDVKENAARTLFRRCLRSVDLLKPSFPGLVSVENVNGPLSCLIRTCGIRYAHILDFEKVGVKGPNSSRVRDSNDGLEKIRWLSQLEFCHLAVVWIPSGKLHWGYPQSGDQPGLREGFASFVEKMGCSEMKLSTRIRVPEADYSWRWNHYGSNASFDIRLPQSVRVFTQVLIWNKVTVAVHGSLSSLTLRGAFIEDLVPQPGDFVDLLDSPAEKFCVVLARASYSWQDNRTQSFRKGLHHSLLFLTTPGEVITNTLTLRFVSGGVDEVCCEWGREGCRVHVVARLNSESTRMRTLLSMIPDQVLGFWYGERVPVSLFLYTSARQLDPEWETLIDGWSVDVRLELRSIAKWKRAVSFD